MDSIKVLVVDDESRMRKLVKDFLSKKGYIVLEAGDGEEAVDIFMNNKDIGLIILDVMMPKMDGWETCKEIRKFSQVPIIMLTAKGTEYDKVLGLDSGADDYVAKPFSMMELMSRIKALLRRSEIKEEKKDTYQVEPLYVNISKHIVKVNDEEVNSLTYKEFELLSMLLQHQETVLSRDQILQSIWGYDFDGESRTVDVHVRTLRQKLGDAGKLIETVRGFGYKIGKAEED